RHHILGDTVDPGRGLRPDGEQYRHIPAGNHLEFLDTLTYRSTAPRAAGGPPALFPAARGVFYPEHAHTDAEEDVFVKKPLTFLAALLLAVSLSACGETSVWQESATVPQTNESLSVFCIEI